MVVFLITKHALESCPGKRRFSGTRASRKRLCNLGPTYRSRPGTETPPREDWKQKLKKKTGAREVWVTAENKTGPCLVCKEKHVYQRKSPWGSLS